MKWPVLLLFLGCSEAANNAAPSVSRRDSAGVTIVESTAPLWGDSVVWTVDPNPVVDLTTSGSGPAHEFVLVPHALRLADGSIAVADRGAHAVKIFSPEGTHLKTVGRDGEGPGEFRRLIRIRPFGGDSLVAFDYWTGRMTVLTPEWDVARVVTPAMLDRRSQELHVLDDTTFVMMPYASITPPPEGGRYRVPQSVTSVSATQDLVDTIVANVPGFESYDHPGGSTDPVFRREAHLDVRAGRIYVGSAESMQYQMFSRTGRLERIVRVPTFDLSLTSQTIQRERDARIVDLPEGPQVILDRITIALNTMPVPATRPAYGDLVVDHDEAVWAIGFQGVSERQEPIEAQVFDPDGTWLGAVELPPRFTVFQIGKDYVLGKWTDELDVEHPQLLRLDRTLTP